MSVCDNKTKIYPDPNPSAPQEPQTYWLNKLSEIEAYFFGEIEVCEQNAKKNPKAIQYNHGDRRQKPNYISSD